MDVCETEKMQFSTKREAMNFGVSIGKRKHNKDPMRAYICPKCQHYHLTSTTSADLKRRSNNKMHHADDKYNHKIKPYQYSSNRK